MSAARSANDPERWGSARSGLDAALKSARRAGERARAHGHDATPEVKALLDASVERLGELDREAASMAEAPSGLTAISREAEIKAILAEPIEGSSASGHSRKEAALRAELDSLDASECRTLAQRLRRARANDALAVLFGRLVPERRQRLLAFLDDARKRDAKRGASKRATAAKQEEARKLVVRAAVALSLPTVPVRLDEHARERTEALGTNAAMSGGEVLLHPEHFDPQGPEALETVAHELVHVAQLGVDGEHGDAEGEAHRIAEQVAAGKQADLPRIKLSGEAGRGAKKPAKPVEPKKPEPSAEDLARREQMLGSLSLVTARWKAIGGTMFTPAEVPEAQPPETFKAAAYELIVVDDRDVEPVGLALAGPGREKHAIALEMARRTILFDRPHLAKIDGDIKYLASGGDFQFSATRLVASHAVASPLAKNAIRKIGSLALGPLWDYAVGAAGEHGTRIRRSQLESEGHVTEYVIMCSGAGGIERQQGCVALFKTLQAGAPVAPLPLAEAPKDAPAIVEEAKALGNAIKHAIGKANKAGIIPVEKLQPLDKLLEKATPRARELVFANEAVMGELARKLAPDQATALLGKLDTIEELYQQIKPSLPLSAKVPTVVTGVKLPLPKLDINNTSYPALRAWLEARAGDQGVRTRVLQHTRLKTDVIDRLILEQQRLIYRLIARGTVVANAEDRAFEAAELGHGADLVRAIRDLAGTDPKRFAELERDSMFRRAAEKMTKPVSVDGVMLKPWDVCQTMWGRSPGIAADPLVGGVSQVNLTGNDLPLTADERHTLDSKLFNPTLEIIRAQVFYKPQSAWDFKPLPRAQKVLDCLREFERLAADKTLRDLLQRDHVVAGVALAQRFERRYGTDLRTWIYESGGPHIRSGVARILGTEQGASVGNFNGELVTLGEAKPGKATLQQALRETLSGGWTMSEWCSVESRQLARGINSEDKGDVLAAWRRFEPHARASADALQTATGMHIRPIDLMRNAHLEHSGNLEANLAAKFNATDRAELEKELGIDVANATDAQQKAKLEPEALAESKFGAPAKLLWMAIQRLGPESDAMEHVSLGGLLTINSLLPRVDGTFGTRADGTHEEQPVKSFGGYYRKNYGTSPDAHVIARIRAMTGSRTVSLDAAAKILGIDVAHIAKPPVAKGELVIDEHNEHLVRGEFTVEVAERRAKQIWEIIHGNGRLELINTLLYGDCNDEEQRLIRIAFRELSGGFDLVFYIRQAIDARQEKAGSTERSVFGTFSNVVAPGSASFLMPSLDDQKLGVGAGDSEVHIHGTATELERALAVSSSGEIDVMTRLSAAAGRSDSDQVFRILEDATPDQLKAILANGAVVDKMRRLGQWQWERCFKTLTGQSDLADRFYSRSHGDGSWSERNFGGTHEAGMEEDIKIYIRKLRVKIDREVRAEVAAMPNKPSAQQIDAEIKRRLLAACGEAAANKSVQAIMRSELEVDELRKMDTQIVNAGTADEWAVAGGGGSTAILSEIRGLGADERARRLKDPQYLRMLGSQLGEKDYREALNALSTAGDADISHGGGALARLDAASRTSAQVEGAESDSRKTLRALSELSPDEYKRLRADPKLQIQVLNALPESERALAREMLGFELGAPETVATDPEAVKAAAEAAAVKRAEFFVHQSIGRLRAGALRAWRDLLVQAVEVFKLDFAAGFVNHNEGGHRKRGAGNEEAPKLDTVALRAKIWDGAQHDVHAFARDHRLHPQKKTKDAITAIQMFETVRDAVAGTADPSEALIRENIHTVDEKLAGQSDAEAMALKVHGFGMDHSVDATGLADTLKSASDQHVVEHWTSVLKPPAGGGDTMAIRYAELKAAEAASDAKNPSVPLASVSTATDEVTPAPEPEPEAKIDAKSERVDDPALRAAIKARRRFLEFQIHIAQALENMLVPYMGDDRSKTQAVEGERLEGRDNKRYNDLSKIIYERIPRLPHEQIGKSLKVEDKHTWLLSSEARRHVGEVNARKQRFLRYRGGQDNNNSSAQDEKEILDEEQALLGREHANAIQDGVVTGGEKERYEHRYEAVDRAQEAHQTAKETAAGWAALIVGVVLTIVVTVLTGGLATGPVAMLALAGATAALSATAKSLVMEQILDGEWDNKDAADMITKEVITGIVTAGTTFYAQKLLAAAAGMTKLAKQGAAVKQVLRKPPKLYQALAHEAAEEATSEAMSSVIDAGMAAIDPAHWMHGYQEGAHEAKQAAFAELAKTGSRVKEAALTSVFTSLGGRALGKMRRGGGNYKPERDRSLEVPASAKKRVDVVRNLKQVLGDPGEKFMEALIQWGMQQDGAINWGSAPQELLRGWLEEMGEAGTEMHTGTVHKHQRETKAKADLARAKDKLSTDEKADFLAMQDGALDSDVYVSVDDYTRIREHVIERGLDATQVRTGVKLTPAQRKAFVAWARKAKTAEELATFAHTDPATLPDVMAAGTEPVAPAPAQTPTAPTAPAERTTRPTAAPKVAPTVTPTEAPTTTAPSTTAPTHAPANDPGSRIAARVGGARYVAGAFHLDGSEPAIVVAVRRTEGPVRLREGNDGTFVLEVPRGFSLQQVENVVASKLQALQEHGPNVEIANEDRARREALRTGDKALGVKGEQGFHGGTEVHSHFLGVVEVETIKDVCGGSYELLLVEIVAVKQDEDRRAQAAADKVAKENPGATAADIKAAADQARGLTHGLDASGAITHRGSAGDALRIATASLALLQDQAALKQEAARRGLPETADALQRLRETLAEEACRKALQASEETDFNSSYEIIDELIKNKFGGDKPVGETKDARAAREKEAYTRFAALTIVRLVRDGLLLTEQSNSIKKLGERFTPEVMQDAMQRALDILKQTDPDAAANIEVKWLSMGLGMFYGQRDTPLEGKPDDPARLQQGWIKELTSQFGESPALVKVLVDERARVEANVTKDPKEKAQRLAELDAYIAQVTAQLEARGNGVGMVQRGDVVGVDMAGQELFTFDDQGKQRFKVMYLALVQAAIEKGEVLVFRPHVGEGAINPETGKPWHAEKDRVEDANNVPIHYKRARENLDAMLDVLAELKGQNLLDGKRIVIRFGHATFTTPAQAQRMAAFDVIAEANPGSNLATRVLDPVSGPKDAKVKRSTTEQLGDHSLLTLIYYRVKTILSTDGHSVENTSMGEEYERAYTMIEQFLAGQTAVRVTLADAGTKPDGSPARGTLTSAGDVQLTVHDLTRAELDRFLGGYAMLHKHANDYRTGTRGGTKIDGQGNPERGPQFANAGPVSDPRSKFTGDQNPQHLTDSDVQAVIDGPLPFLPPNARRVPNSNLIELTNANDPTQKMQVVIEVGEVQPITVTRGGQQQVMTPVAQYDRDAALTPNAIVGVTIARGARPEDIGRALAHELHEIQALLDDWGNVSESAPAQVARHDRQGRVGELGVLFARLLPAAKADGLERERAQALIVEIDGVLAELGVSRSSDRAALTQALGAELAAQVSKLDYLLNEYQATGQADTAGGVRIYGHESDLSSIPKPGHIMGTHGDVHSSFAPQAGMSRDARKKVGQPISPFEGAVQVTPEVMPGQHFKDPSTDSHAKGNYDFDHSFSEDFLPGEDFKRAVAIIERIQRDNAQYKLVTARDANVQAHNCITDLMAKLMITHTHYMRADGTPVMVLDAYDMAMLNLRPDGSAQQGADVRTHDLYQHLRWKEHELASNPDLYTRATPAQIANKPEKGNPIKKASGLPKHMFDSAYLDSITPGKIGEARFGGEDFMNWGEGPVAGPAQCQKRMADLQNDTEVARLAALGITPAMANAWAIYYEYETAQNPVLNKDDPKGNRNAPARAELMRYLATRLATVKPRWSDS